MILVCGDVHFCQYSSILRERGIKYSKRLENILESINFVERTATEKNVDAIVYLGDFFDKPNLNDEELTALKEIKWSDISHYFIVGNHESSVNELLFNSTKTLEDINRHVIDNFKIMTKANDSNFDFAFLPYCTEDCRVSISKLFNNKETNKRIIFSHNDIKGIQMGPIISKQGYEIADIESNCDLFINGHIHNGSEVTKKIINLGNLTGQNFGEDAYKYSHNIMLLDEETLKYELIENPYAFNFYKIEINNEKDFTKLATLKSNAVVNIKCEQSLLQDVKKLVNEAKNIVASRILTYRELINRDNLENAEITAELVLNAHDPLERFTEFIKNRLGNDEIVLEELSAIIEG
mgnify:CR=1 FL=1